MTDCTSALWTPGAPTARVTCIGKIIDGLYGPVCDGPDDRDVQHINGEPWRFGWFDDTPGAHSLSDPVGPQVGVGSVLRETKTDFSYVVVDYDEEYGIVEFDLYGATNGRIDDYHSALEEEVGAPDQPHDKPWTAVAVVPRPQEARR